MSLSYKLDFQDVSKRTAAKLKMQAEVLVSCYDGKQLPKVRRTGKQLLPIFPELLDQFAVSWRNKRYREKNLVVGRSMLDCKGKEGQGLHNMPPLEPVVAANLQPKAFLSSPGCSLLHC